MGCKYEFQGKLYTESQLKVLLQNKGVQNQIKVMLESEEESYSPYSTDDDFWADEDTPIEITLKHEKINKHKYALIDMYSDRISNLEVTIKQLMKEGNNKKVQEYAILKIELENRIKQLKDETKKYNKKNPLSLTEFRYQAMLDLARVVDLLNTGKLGDDPYLNKEIFENAEEAKRIINFYKAMEFVKTNKTVDGIPIDMHPIFLNEEIYDADGLPSLLPEEVRNAMNDIADDFKYYEQQLNELYRSIVTQVVNSNPNIQKLYGELTYEDITKALPDLSIDAWLFDISKGSISGDNGILPQIVMSLFMKAWDEQESKFNQFREKHDALLPKVKKALAAAKKSLKALGIPNVSYDLFFQNQNGKKTSKLVQRYSADFTDIQTAMEDAYEQAIESAMNEQDPAKRNKKYFKAFETQQNWLRENTLVFDIRKIPEIAEQFPEFAEHFIEDDGHTQELKNAIGEKGYQKELENQIKKLKDYAKWKNNYTVSYLMSIGVDSVNNLSPAEKDQLNYQIMLHNPFHAVSTIYETNPATINGLLINPLYKFNTFIPRRNKVLIDRKKSFETGKYEIIQTKESTGYYDQQFEIIEKDPTLLEYHELITNELQDIYDSLPSEIKEKIFSNSLFSSRKGIYEIFSDPNISLIKKLVKIAARFYDSLKSGFGINPKSSMYHDNVDVITNRLEPKVNSSFISDNRAEVDKRKTIEHFKFAQLQGVNIHDRSIIEYSSLSPAALDYLVETLNLKNPIELKNKFGENIPVAKLIENAIVADLVENQSINLPQMIKYYSKMAHEYTARQEMLPYMKIMKQHYEQIGKAKRKNGKVMTLNGETYVDGTRSRGISQFQEWFDRVALGHYGDDGLFGGWTLEIKSDNAKRKNFVEKLKAFGSGRILTTEERKLKRELNKLIDEATDPNDIKKLNEVRESLGKNIAVSAMFDSLLNYIRFLRLGYNISSAITNFLEGQIANMTIAATGDYFETKHYHRALNITKGSMLKSLFGGYSKGMTKGAFKARKLIDRYNVLQDSANELQKAAVDTPLAAFEKFSPMEVNKRTEYLNQTPLMIAILLDTTITGTNGEISSVWDALDNDGNLKENFRTEENINTWEKGTGEKYHEFKSKVNNAIVMAHGNYDKLRGMMIKKNIAGKALMLLKTWIGSQLYQRLATERDDVETGIKGFKGRLHSHTPLSGGLHAGIWGLSVIGFPYGVLVGAALGAAGGAYNGVRTDLGIFKQSLFTLKAIVRKMIATPINFVGSTFTGNQIIEEYVGFEKLINTDVYEKGHRLEGKQKFTERDMKNMKALIADMSFALSFMTLTLIVKGLYWDDDDEEDSLKRQWHNVLVNRSIQLTNSTLSYLDPRATYEIFVNNAFIGFLNDGVKFGTAMDNYLKGELSSMKFYEKASKVLLPSILKDNTFGFASQMEKQFIKTPFDEYFEDVEKTRRRQIEVKREEYRDYLEKKGITDPKKRDRLVNIKYKLPKDIKDTESKTAIKSVKKPIDIEQNELYKEELRLLQEEEEKEEQEEQEENTK